MIGLIGETILIMAIVFAAGGFLLCFFNDEEDNSIGKMAKKIIDSCLLIVIVYCFFIAVYVSGNTYEGIPFSGLINEQGSLHSLFVNDIDLYIFNLMELITVTFVCGIITNWFPISKLAGKNIFVYVFYCLFVIILGLVINHYVIKYAKTQEVFNISLILLKGIITGGVITLTPAMVITQIVSNVTGLDEKAPIAVLFVEKLSSSSIGKAIKTAFSSSIVFLFGMYVIEKQMGSIHNATYVLSEYIAIFTAIGIVVIGIMLMISAILPHKDKNSKVKNK